MGLVVLFLFVAQISPHPTNAGPVKIKARRYSHVTIEELRHLATKGEPDAIYQLGVRKDAGSLSLLEGLARQNHVLNGTDKLEKISVEARRAMVQIGAHPDISDYIQCASSATTHSREHCIRMLGYIGDIRAVRHLGPMLFEPRGMYQDPLVLKNPKRNTLKPPYAEYASQALGRILPQVQARFMIEKPDQSSHLKQWQYWWEGHENLGEERYNDIVHPQPNSGFRKLFK